MQTDRLIDLPSLEQVMERSPVTASPDTIVRDVLAGVIAQPSDAPPYGDDRGIPRSISLPGQRLLNLEQRGCLLVVEAGRLLGLVTERELVQLAARGTDLSRVRLAEVMQPSPPVLTASEAVTLADAFRVMRQQQIQHLPIVDPQGQLRGLLTQARLYQTLQPVHLLHLRSVAEVMTTPVIQAPATASVQHLAHLMAEHTVQAVVVLAADQRRGSRQRGKQPQPAPIGLVTAAEIVQLQFQSLDLAQIPAETVLKPAWVNLCSTDSIWEAYQVLQARSCLHNVVVSGVVVSPQGELLGLVTPNQLLQGLDPLALVGIMTALEQQLQAQAAQEPPVSSLRQQAAMPAPQVEQLGDQTATDPTTLELLQTNQALRITLENLRWTQSAELRERRQAEAILQQQLAREHLLASIARDIYHSLDVTEVLQRTVEQVRQLLDTDRVVIFRFQADWQGTIVMESVGSAWISLLATTISDPCFRDRYVELYRQGRVSAIPDIHAVKLPPCYLELLLTFQVRAYLVVPILQGEQLWGLLVAHHCSAPRPWKQEEMDLLQQLAVHVGIAIQQSELYQRTHQELLERQRIQDALQESEERFRSLSASAPIGIWQTNTDGICLYSNACWQEMSGLSQEDCLGDGWTRAIHPADRPTVMAAWEAYLAGEQEFSQEFRLLTPGGELRWVSSHAASMRSTTGQIMGYVSTAQDITQLKQAKAALQQQLEREQLVALIAQRIRQTLDLNEILGTTVAEVRQFLQADRVFIYRFHADWSGTVVVESVAAEWPSALEITVEDTYFMETGGADYLQRRVQAIDNIDTAGLTPCHRELLAQFQVKANLAVAVLQAEKLWGLLVVNQCVAPRHWQPEEIELLQRLATQVGIAIQQSELYQQTRQELLERRRMQHALQESEERFRLLSACAPIGIGLADATGACLYVNRRWQVMTGLTLEASLGNGWQQAIHPEDRETAWMEWQACLQQHRDFAQELRLLTPTGELRWANTQVTAMHSDTGEIIGYVAVSEEITDRKQAEHKIREQAALIDIATDAIFVRDLQNHILFWSQGAERLYGWSGEEALGKKANELLYKEPASESISALDTVLKQGSWQGELEKVTKLGKNLIVASRWTLVRDEAGRPQAILIVNTDITEKKQLEAQFYRTQRLESLGTLASGIAHDLNNVFTPILTIAQLLPFKLTNLDVRTQEMLEVLTESAKRGTDLVKQTLTFARGTEGKRISLQTKHLLQEISKIIKQTFPKSIEIALELPAHPLWLVSADPTQLHQVCMNLVVNARDAMPNGGTLTLSVDNRWIDATYARMNLDAREGAYLVITITDTGTGISASILERIFDPFFTTKEMGKGTGLGLSTVLGIVKNHAGFVQVTSDLGKGTQFKVYLPAIEGVESTLSREEVLPQGKGEWVLIVDDEATVRQTTTLLLEDSHYRTLTASDGIEAITLYAEHKQKISVVLVDIMMPNMDGFTTIRTLKKMNPQVKAIAASGLPSNKSQAFAVGARAFLAKPFSAEDLLTALQELLAVEEKAEPSPAADSP